MALIVQNISSATPSDLQRLVAASAVQGEISETPGSGENTLADTDSPNLLLQVGRHGAGGWGWRCCDRGTAHTSCRGAALPAVRAPAHPPTHPPCAPPSLRCCSP